MSKPSPEFDMNELDTMLAEIQAAQFQDQDYLIVSQVAAQTGYSVKTIRAKLKRLILAGKMRYIGKRPAESVLTGQRYMAPAYKIVEEEQA